VPANGDLPIPDRRGLMAEAGTGPSTATGPGTGTSTGVAGTAGDGVLAAGYARAVRERILAHRRYPRAARRLGQEGRARLRIAVRRDGALAAAPRLLASSGHAVLDREAERMARAAAPFPPAPPELARRIVDIELEVRFDLADDDGR
jgi:protein TonB